jgi:WD40 repeat protein
LLHNHVPISLTVTPDGKCLLTSDIAGNLKQWDIATQELLKNYEKVHDDYIRSIAVSSGTPCYILTSSLGDIKQINMDQKIVYREWGIVHPKTRIHSMTCHPDGQTLFTSDGMGVLREWNIEEGNLVKDWGEVHQTEYINSIAVSRDGKY